MQIVNADVEPGNGTSNVKIHLDTDLGGDPDDACALAMLLGWPDAEITGITTNLDADGRRAGMVCELLRLAGRQDIPVGRGAGASLTTGSHYAPQRDDPLYWDAAIASRADKPGEAFDLLEKSIETGATVAAIGACTNLAMLETIRPGLLKDTRVVLMGGWIEPAESGFPDWGPEMDWNVQCDARAAQIVARTADLTLVTLPVTLKAHLRGVHLSRLRSIGPLGELLARQAEAYAREARLADLSKTYTGLPSDLLNFHYDPVTCAVAAGWTGALVEEMQIEPVLEDDVLRFVPDVDGRAINVVTDIDAADFEAQWFGCLASAQRAAFLHRGNPDT